MRHSKVGVFILLLAGIFSIIFLISTSEHFVKSHIRVTREKLSQIRVEVLNGTDISGLAERTADLLRSIGFDVIEVGNVAKDTVPATVIFDRVDPRLENARLVRRTLKQGKIVFESHPLQLVEVTVVLGEDYKERKRVSGLYDR